MLETDKKPQQATTVIEKWGFDRKKCNFTLNQEVKRKSSITKSRTFVNRHRCVLFFTKIQPKCQSLK